jgi:hypothetical protein
MAKLRNGMLTAIFITGVALVAFGQGPLHKRVNYTINVSHAVRMGDYVLPPGKYVLYQVNQNDLNLFGLYRKNMTHPPIAMIRTVRVDYQSGDYPEKATIELDIDESRSDDLPVLRGWNIPGMDGWEIIGVVPKEKSTLVEAKQFRRR